MYLFQNVGRIKGSSGHDERFQLKEIQDIKVFSATRFGADKDLLQDLVELPD